MRHQIRRPSAFRQYLYIYWAHGFLRRAGSPLHVCTPLGCQYLYIYWAMVLLDVQGALCASAPCWRATQIGPMALLDVQGALCTSASLGCQYLYIYWAHGSQILSILIIWASWPRNVLHLFRLVNNPKAPQPRFIELKWALGTKASTRLAKQSWEHQVCLTHLA